MSLHEVLENAVKVNDEAELKRIITDINERDFFESLHLIECIKKHVLELDPFDPEAVIRHIVENIESEKKSLLDPVNIIMEFNIQKKKRSRKLFGCFGGA